MRRKLPLASLALVVVVVGCHGLQSDGDCTGPGAGTASPYWACGIYADAGVDGDGGPAVVVPPGCDPTKPPGESPECVTDDFGVFVSPAGKDGAAGTKADPVKSIAEAVARGKPRVYLCEGKYEAAVEVKAPIAIFGGLTCAWAPSATARAKLAPPKGVAFRVTKVSGAVSVDDLDIVGSADANEPGATAVAAFVSESADVTFRRVNLTAGAGTAGATGAGRSNYSGAVATVGGSANGGTAGAGALCACTDGSTSKGGNGSTGNGLGLSDGVATPAIGVSNAGTTGTTTCTDGLAGANGTANAGGAAATSPGQLSASGWAETAKSPDAPNGKPAQGGGGGGAKTNVNSAGGGGACGGCGGAGGASGTSGGSSFPVLSFNSSVRVEGGSLTSGPGGAGGAGADGQPGQSGGGLGAGAACNGGPGGDGAGGSGGGGGAGGHSVPVAFVGTEPRVSGATLTPGPKGAVGPGGKPGVGAGNAGSAGAPGPEGKAQGTLAL